MAPTTRKNTRRAVIFANGLIPDLGRARKLLLPSDTLLAADGGSRHLFRLGLSPQVAIGDFDSLNGEEIRQLHSSGSTLIPHPRDKDATDLELCLEHAVEHGFTRILVVGALGGRLDQSLANLALASAQRFAGVDLLLDDGCEQAFFVRRRARLEGETGETVSLLAWGAPVTGLVTRGLAWRLRGETLLPDRTRGISNVMNARRASIELDTGLLLLIHRRGGESREGEPA
jgi:thiamine pyrophosphokinase